MTAYPRPEDDVAGMLRPHQRRDRRLRLVAAVGFGLAATVAVAGLAPARMDLAALAGIGGFALALAVLWRQVPSLAVLARGLDRDLDAKDRIATALEIEATAAPQHGSAALARALREEALGLRPAIAAHRPRSGAGTALAASLAALTLAAAMAGAGRFWLSPHGDAPQASSEAAVNPGSAPGSAPESAETAVALDALADKLRRDADPGNDRARGRMAEELSQLAGRMRRDGLSETLLREAAELLAAMPEPPESLAWLSAAVPAHGGAPAASGARPAGSLAPSVASDLVRNGGADRDLAHPEQPRIRADAAMAGDAAIAQGDAEYRRGRLDEGGTNDFVPPHLIEGAPRAAQAFDMAGTGAAERRDSLTARGGGTEGAALAEPQAAARPGSDRVDLYATTPLAGKRVRYYLGPDPSPAMAEDVTAGTLPDWPALPLSPVGRHSPGPGRAEVILRYFDRMADASP